MNEDLLNVMGSFSEISLDCLEKQNEEIEQLEEENKQLKERIRILTTHPFLKSKVADLEKQLDLYKSVIDEVREYIKNNNLYHYEYDEDEIFERIVSNKKELLEILKEKNKEE